MKPPKKNIIRLLLDSTYIQQKRKKYDIKWALLWGVRVFMQTLLWERNKKRGLTKQITQRSAMTEFIKVQF